MYSNRHIIDLLPDEFRRQDLLKVVFDQGYSLSKAHQIIEYGCISGLLIRVGRGKYQKAANKRMEVITLHEKGMSYRMIAEKLGISKSLVGNYIGES